MTKPERLGVACCLRCWLLTICMASLVAVSATTFAIDVFQGQVDQLAGSQCDLRVRWVDGPVPSHLRWRLMSGERTLAVGMSLLVHNPSASDTVSYTLAIDTPDINPSIVLRTTLYLETQDRQPLRSVPIRLWHRDPFADSPFCDRHITIVDPTDQWRERLRDLSLQCRFATDVEEVEDAEWVIVAQTVPWDRRLESAVKSWVHSGVKILILQSSGTATNPLDFAQWELSSMRFFQLNDGSWSHKDADEDYWRVEQLPSTLAIDFSSDQPCLLLGHSPPANEWERFLRWQVAEFRVRGGGHCLMLGVPVEDRWDTSASPRILLKHLFEQLDFQNSQQPK